MKNLLLLNVFLFIIISSCSKDENGHGSIKITVSNFNTGEYFSTYDVLAKAYIFSDTIAEKFSETKTTFENAKSGKLIDVYGIEIKNNTYTNAYLYSGDTGNKGVVKFVDVPAGKYLIVVTSGKFNLYSTKWVSLKLGENASLIKRFNFRYPNDNEAQDW